MAKISFYVDSNIYLNLWRDEKDFSGIKDYGEIARRFFKKLEKSNRQVIYSGFILKELFYILGPDLFREKTLIFEKQPNFIRQKISKKGYSKAKIIEKELKYEISFYDILHMLLAEETNSILVTRDRKLLATAEQFKIKVGRPEDLFEVVDFI